MSKETYYGVKRDLVSVKRGLLSVNIDLVRGPLLSRARGGSESGRYPGPRSLLYPPLRYVFNWTYRARGGRKSRSE